MSDNKKIPYWEFKNQTDVSADLYVYKSITSWGEGEYSVSAKSFKKDLDNLGDVKELNIYINSPGGDVFEGVTITNMLKRKKCTKNVYIDGLAASIASVIAMAGDNIVMPSNSMLMIHNAWSGCWGNAKEMRETADKLDKITASLRQTYLDKAGDLLDEDTLIELMDNETWLTAQEAYDYGLCTQIGEESNIAACIDDNLFKNYMNTPSIFKNVVKNETKTSKEDDLLRKNLIKASEVSIKNINKILGIN